MMQQLELPLGLDAQSGLIISFGYTCDELLNHQKSVTRRVWKDTHAAKFQRAAESGKLVRAFNKDVRRGGCQVGWLRLSTPYKERLIDMPDNDVALEGFFGLSKQEFLDRFFAKVDSHQLVWVIRFSFWQL